MGTATNYILLLWLTLTILQVSVIYAHFVSKENLFMLRSLLNDWNYFWIKYCNLPFCSFKLPLLIFLASSWYQKTKITLQTSLRNKKNLVNKNTYWGKMINYQFKGLYKTACYKTKSNFSQNKIFPLCLLYECFFFLFPCKSVCKFWKIDKISSASFHFI